ncbi:diacylglycerol O-acyltransferase 1 isoform X1 [Vanessa atalanta]|uniref:diacylglycerol O-acyltransferase 1 isoform X1 n=1 Tax=Vanessa atalanta TaxID=42275 RepID=UPI001FCDD460|nr:diacylglycerol O-acyltransferase 1 isoform X1 [Vanessa atalanta]XP_047544974.1 diacylglycerol O-acyltransferase 1 isoform X1 [Vanessa atalanta]XP_047544975.1 diacylglycerol O-acyltransferase 1 isoform X1 [Vanessa atalanta]XP_047544976.1 diacylglycerol O-acyltransferase 1 isoform X1 [Vanessa atalanta]XP_047544977.1 diacylglycerol O-acyltransferase 1 isoform X1 [Vanessa atalanta]
MSNKTEENAVRYRRAQSVTKAEEITEKEKKARKSQLDKPCHKPRDSLFSWSSEFTNFTGLVNWGFLMLTIGGLRLCLENFLKYGIRVNPFEWIIVLTGHNEGYSHQYPSVILLIFSVVPAVTCLLIEKAIAVEILSQKLGVSLQIINMVSEISLPVIILYFKGTQFSFVGITTVCTIYLVLFLKLWSYCQTNHWCRLGMKGKQYKNTLRRQSLSAPNWNELVNAEHEQTLEDEKHDFVSAGLVKYPDNLTLKDLFYFLLAPTLCYELNFPRTTRIRKRFLIKRIIEVVFGMNLVMALFQQWMIPSVRNAVDPFSEMGFVKMTERLLKLAVPNHLIWLCFFYLSFHSFLNLMGELLHFADRNFYSDWWNANNISVFWSSWNMPVHLWAVRHVYIPMTEIGYTKGSASIVVFFISAFFHEYLVSVPLQMFRVWAFLGMMAQPPLSVISRVVEKKLGARWGNIIVWSSLILGQPLAIMMYYHDYALAHFAPQQ